MIRSGTLFGLVVAFAANAGAQQKLPTPAPIVFFDIAGPETAKLQAFYADLFGWRGGDGGQLTVPVTSPVPATIRQDPVEKRIYIGVENITAKLQEIKAHGGTIDAPRFEVKGVVILALFKDPAGNPMALVEMENGKPKIP